MMSHKLEPIQNNLERLQNGSLMKTYNLYPGIDLSFIIMKSNEIALKHDALKNTLEINCCRAGRMGWNMGNGINVYLGPSDFSLNTMEVCANSIITLPNGYYEGFTLCVDLKEFSNHPPEILIDTGITGALLYNKFCKDRTFTSLAGNEQTQPIFCAFYNQPESIQLAFWKLKAVELLLYLYKIECSTKQKLTEYQSEQVEVIREIHDYLTQNISKKITIEVLSKQYLMNSTTLKTIFKAVYGNSIAAHIKEHRMELAAELLLTTQKSLAQIAQAVGYGSQSKFTATFKEYFQMLPSEYRKKH